MGFKHSLLFFMTKLESTFKTELKKEIKRRLPGCIVAHMDAQDIQGIPDIIVLYKNRWAALEGKREAQSTHRPNQDYYVDLMNGMSFSSFIYPENKEAVLDAMERSLKRRT